MIVMCNRTTGGLNICPSELLVNCAFDGRTYECATTLTPDQLVNLSYELIGDFYAHSHLTKLVLYGMRRNSGGVICRFFQTNDGTRPKNS
jgi:hypothetical protein